MESVQGKIINNNGEVLVEAMMQIDHVPSGRGVLGDWFGLCDVPKDHKVMLGTYELILNDGRSGNILVTNTYPLGSTENTLVFQGSGVLK